MKRYDNAGLAYILINDEQVDYYKSCRGGVPEAPLIEWAEQFLRRDTTFIDIGAHCGTWSLHFAKYLERQAWEFAHMHGNEPRQGNRVLSFEPQRSTFYQLCGGIALNDLSQTISAYNIALGVKASSAVLRQVSVDGGGSSIQEIPTHNKSTVIHTEIVDVETLDDFLRSHEAKLPISLIKIDVEGNEANVLRGARNTLDRYRPKILLESWDPKVRPWAAHLREDTFDVLETLRYSVTVTSWPDMILAEPKSL